MFVSYLAQEDTATILNALMPHLLVKDEHAKKILELIDLKNRRELTRESVTRIAKLYLEIRQLNTKGAAFDPAGLKDNLDRYIDNYFRSSR